MSKLTAHQKKKARNKVRERDGDKCADPTCNKPGDAYRKEKGREFDIHHIDRNPENNPEDGSNHQLMCHSCNCKRDPRGKTVRPKFAAFKNLKLSYMNEGKRTWEGDREWEWEQRNIQPATMKKNKEAEPAFRRAVIELIAKVGEMKRKFLLDAACEKADCSQAAGARYLDKMCSLYGEYGYHTGKDGEMIVRNRKE